MEATIPVGINIKKDSFDQVIKKLHKPSIMGLKIDFFDDKDINEQHICTFMPTLSSLCMMVVSEKKKTKMVEFHEDQPPFKRKPLSMALKDNLA